MNLTTNFTKSRTAWSLGLSGWCHASCLIFLTFVTGNTFSMIFWRLTQTWHSQFGPEIWLEHLRDSNSGRLQMLGSCNSAKHLKFCSFSWKFTRMLIKKRYRDLPSHSARNCKKIRIWLHKKQVSINLRVEEEATKWSHPAVRTLSISGQACHQMYSLKKWKTTLLNENTVMRICILLRGLLKSLR